MEILLGLRVPGVNVEGIEPTLFVHKEKCLPLFKTLKGKSCEDAAKVLPDGPLKKAFIESGAKLSKEA